MRDLAFIFAIVVIFILVVSCWKVLYLIWWRPMKLEKYLKKQGIKGPPYRLLYGNLKEERKMKEEAQSKPISLSHNITQRVVPLTDHTMKKYGKMSVVWYGVTPTLHIMDPEQVKDILSNKIEQFQKLHNPFTEQLLPGLANYEGEKWAKHRRIITPAFHLEKLKRMLPAFLAGCNELIRKWDQLVEPEGSCELDMWPEVQNLTGDIISRTAFGTSYEEGMRIFQLLNEHAKIIIQDLIYTFIPGYRLLPTKMNKRIKEINREVEALLRGIIKQRELSIKLGEATKDDLLGLLLESNFKEIQEHGAMSNEELMEECKLFYFAGQETTANLLLWTIVVLSMHQVWQKRAREEVLEIFGENKPDFDQLNRLKIVPMILYEVLRLYPPVFLSARCSDKKIKLGKTCLPPGIQLLIPIISIHHSREFWGEDAEEFKPERFYEGVSKAAKTQAFFPFGWGPRICIGQNFAMAEAKVALAMILQHFSFELSPSYTHAPMGVITLQPQYGAQIILHKL
ncbi:PREDICTED: cytochrome P450 CYP72A219-like [Nelumbo nucifera]|uniref:Cytochrome P450 CYP72A219-like n=2 Tax=Nelumbo nucifera TaxID=4432 RepID=A0A822Z2V5_NELNU|nr:PREDICTED: cytochrome P450 CYP72A219-like [Nelumbo nucifera]DAD37789.1 TPA_asm: hypothetical protein HUJ06_008430 [Nelumbo nucifera]